MVRLLQAVACTAAMLTLSVGQTWAQTTIATGGTTIGVSGSPALGAITRNAGGSVVFNGTAGGTATGSATLLNGILPWAGYLNNGTAANNIADGYTFATIASGNVAPYTAATAAAAGGAWGGIPSGNNSTVNYDSSGTFAVTGLARNVNSIRFTGAGGTQGTNNNNFIALTVNALMNAGTGNLTIGSPTGNILAMAPTAGSTELVLAAATAGFTYEATGRIYNVGATNNGAGVFTNGATATDVTLTGPNTVTMRGTAFHTGATYVNGGTLVLAGAGVWNNTSGIIVNGTGAKFVQTSSVASTPAITITKGTLDGTTTVGAVTIADLASNTVTNGNAGVGTLTAGSLTFGGDATANVQYSGAAGIAVTGALTTTPANGTVVINPSLAGGSWSLGLNNLISFGSLNGSIGNFSLGTVTGLNARQVSGGLQLNGNNIALNVTGDSIAWSGAGTANWTTATTGNNAGPNAWVTVGGKANTNFWAADSVQFNDTYDNTNSGGGVNNVVNSTVSINSGDVSPGSVTFNNSAVNYVIQGANGIATGAVTKNGTGSVTLNTANAYAGGTTFNGGTLNVNTPTALGTGAVTIGPGSAKTLNNTSSTPVVLTANNAQNWNDNFTFTGSVDGLSDLDMGTGVVTVGGAGTDRTVTVSAGTLAVGEVRAAAHGFVKQGSGTLALSSVGANIAGSNIAGTLNVAAGTVQINRTGADAANSGDLYVGGLTGTGTITNGAAATRWVFVNQAAATSSTFDGLLTNGAGGPLGLNKTGAGTLTLTGANDLSDVVTIDAGTLAFSGSGSLANAVRYDIGSNGAVFQVNSSTRISANQININSTGAGLGPGAGSTSRLELSGNSILSNPVQLAPRNDTNGSDAIRNVSGNNELNGLINIVTGGNWSRVQSDAGLLTLGGGVTTSAGLTRRFILQGAGNGAVTNAIYDNINNAAGNIAVIKDGAGTWTLSGFNTYTGNTVVANGILSITQADALADTSGVSIFADGKLNLPSGTQDTVNYLYLKGQSMPAGVYNASNSMGLITGTGSLLVQAYDLPGDFDNNGIVEAADLAVWKTGFTAITAVGDANGDTITDGSDFLIWQRNLGATLATVATAAVPEPATAVGLAFATIALVSASRKRA